MSALEPEAVGVTFSGYLEKKGNMRWQQRWFELHGDTLLYYNEKGEKPRGELLLTQSSSVGALQSSEATGFQVMFSGGKALKVRAPSVEAREAWMGALHTVLHQVQNLQATLCPKTEEVFVIPKRYVIKKKLGQGAYGCVAAGIDEELGKPVAIKKVKKAFEDTTDAKRILREIRLMRSFDHPNVLSLYDLVRPPSLDHFDDVYIVTSRMDQDLQSIVFSKTPLSEDQTQWILYQCLAGLKYLHSAGVVHRDLKPANLLIDLESCDVKICDFGLSRVVAEETEEDMEGDNTLYVVTRWYRSPEVLLGYTHYDKLVDLWSLGCIFGELMHRRPLLDGSNFVNQLEKINDFLGTPPLEDLWFVTNEKALNFMQNVLPKKRGVDLAAKFGPAASPAALDLLRAMLTVDPKKRIDANGALAHPYLADVREAEKHEVEAKGGVVDADDIEAMELTEQNLKRMMFQEIVHFHEKHAI